ncbi:MAG: hypothetical protein IKE20_02185 [Eggerthellaceae bacterium]|nr:hypothetical protein [Eggerthellaceae bacterium]
MSKFAKAFAAVAAAMAMACLLCAVVGCGSQSNAKPKPEMKDYGPPEDISLNAEEAEAFGVHLLLPDNSTFQVSSADDTDPNYAGTINDPTDPLTLEVGVDLTYFPADKFVGQTNLYVSKEAYTPAAALRNWANAHSSSDSITVKEKTYIAGTAALITTYTRTREDSLTHTNRVYEYTDVGLIMKSGEVNISYRDLGGRYGDLIQQSIDSIRIDEDEIPDYIRAITPEGLQAAGLLEQPWEIDGEDFGIYVNPPADFIPLERSEGNYEWIAPDGNTVLSAEVTDTSTFGLDGEDLKLLQNGLAAKMPGFSDFEYSYGEHNDLCASKIKFRRDGDSGEVWEYLITVAPRQSGEAIAVRVASRSGDNVELPAVMNVLRYADGWSNGGVLNMEEIAVSPENQG